ncbi:MAG TPA: hypothetical protein VFM75_10715 [Modicisalibacter sp.]|nr:hypothetical protein [Modicisalibacter sp.]
MVIFNSLITLPAFLHETLVVIGQLALAMAALGFETRLEKLKTLGMKPFLLAFFLFAMLLIGGLGMTRFIMS